MVKRLSYIQRIGIVIVFVVIIFVSINFLPAVRYFRSSIFGLERSIVNQTADTQIDCSDQTIALMNQISKLRVIESENATLRKMLDFFKTITYQHVVANVIGRDPLTPTLISLDRGSNDGVSTGSAVMTQEGVLIGKIIAISADSSLVQLITSDSSRFAAISMGSSASSTSGLIRGTIGNALRMEFVKESDSLAIGDSIVTSGLELSIPRGLLIGTVQRLSNSDDELFTIAAIKPFVDYSTISMVAIVKKS